MRSPSRRFTFVVFCLALWGGVVVLRLGWLQLVKHEDYVARAVRQQERTVSLTPVRGSILDRRGRVLAESVISDSIYADPQQITDVKGTARALAAVPGVQLTERELRIRLSSGSEFVWVARQLPREPAARIRELALPGVFSIEEHRRVYPNGKLAANVLGYVSLDGEGLAGVELSADRWVKGKSGKVTLLRDARRGVYLVGTGASTGPLDGKDVVLTIDAVIQHIAESALGNAIEKYRPRSASVVIMDPNDGAILAMVSYPTFDPNSFRDFSPDSWRNRPVQDIYEPGSTFKIIPAAAALEEGVITASQMIDCQMGEIQLGNVRIHEHGGHRYGWLSFEDALAHSSNVGIIKVGLAVGRQRLYSYIRRFGFGTRTGITLPGEENGILRKPARWSQLSNGVISMGQEIGVTPLQLVRSVSAIANGGSLISPKIVERVVDAAGSTVFEPGTEPAVRVVSERTAVVLNEMLKTVVARGTGTNAALNEYVVAGKTGTAQKPSRGGYGAEVVASFIGYVPADRPRLTILVLVDEPKGAQYGGTIAAPVFREIAHAALRYLKVPPSLPQRELPLSPSLLASFSQKGRDGEVTSPRSQVVSGVAGSLDLVGTDARTAVARATSAGFEVRTVGNGVVISQRVERSGKNRRLALMLASTREASK